VTKDELLDSAARLVSRDFLHVAAVRMASPTKSIQDKFIFANRADARELEAAYQLLYEARELLKTALEKTE
jgi:hypothetical protein